MYELVRILKHNDQWDKLWNEVESDFAMRFLSTDHPKKLHKQLVSLRDLRSFMESDK